MTTTTTESYQKTGLNNGEEYCYKISAVDTSNNEGEKSDEVCATPTQTDQEDDDEDNDNGGGGGGNPPGDGDGDSNGDGDDGDGETYTAPIADAGGPYEPHFIGESIEFDGSGSTNASSYSWDFGDDNTATGEVVNYSYSDDGFYTVTLTVTGLGGSDSDSAEIEIRVGSNPPENITIEGDDTGRINQTLNFNVSADDPDGQNISYNINWGDGNEENTSFYTTGSLAQITHNWTSAGVYTVEVTATDETNLISEKNSLEVYINTIKIEHNGSFIGYLQDSDDDNVYDSFENKETGNKTTVTQDNDSNYMIDSDGNGEIDYLYNETTGATTQYEDDTSGDQQPDETDDSDKKDIKEDDDNTMLIVGGIILLLILAGVVFFVVKKKK